MGKILALLSGKGGSGKTTLALSMATMLSNCGIRVLLIDSDLSTNGATYFYENRLSEHGRNTASFYNILFGLDNQEQQLISINKHMDFLPSIIQVTKKNTKTFSYTDEDNSFTKKIKNEYRKNYDVVIFDCQAGYTDSLKLILPLVDINLVVMEADAISSASIRSLYLKIGDLLNENKIYQIFNKATDEEYETYSKISGGTVFTNIETVKFDWKIRKAFSIAEIPDMEKTSANYGVQIFSICKILFKEEVIQSKLKKYEISIELNRNLEQEKELEEKISMLQYEKSISKSKMHRIFVTTAMGIMATMFCYLFYELVESKVFLDSIVFIPVIFLLSILTVIIFLFYTMLMESTKERRSRYKQIDMYREKLEMLLEDKQELQKKYEQFESDNSDQGDDSQLCSQRYFRKVYNTKRKRERVYNDDIIS